MEDERVGDDEYDYEYEDDDIDDDDMAAGDSGGGGASAGGGGAAGSGKGAAGGGGGGASSAAEAEVDLALRDETAVAFVDQAQLKVLMSKVVSDIRYVQVCPVVCKVGETQNTAVLVGVMQHADLTFNHTRGVFASCFVKGGTGGVV